VVVPAEITHMLLLYSGQMAEFKSHTSGTFCLFELSTTDQDGAKSFYTSLFNWSCDDNPNSPVGIYTMFTLRGRDVGGAYTQFKEQTAAGMRPFWDLYISITSADRTAKKAAQLGGKVIIAPFDVSTYGRMAVIRDPTGAAFCIWEAKSHIGVQTKNEPGSFCWADLATPHPETAAKFYTDLFGWTTIPGDGGYLHLRNGDEFIGGIPPCHTPAGVPPHWTSYVQVKDCDETVARARELGAKIRLEPESVGKAGRMSVLSDPQGATFAIFEVAERS
jgi:hypothetical protein